MVLVSRASSWKAVTILLLLYVIAVARVLLVAVSVATNTQLLAEVVAKLEMASKFSCQ